MDDQERLQMHAAKLLEVILLDYRGQVNQYVPKYVELALTRLTRPLVSSELRTLCMQVIFFRKHSLKFMFKVKGSWFMSYIA